MGVALLAAAGCRFAIGGLDVPAPPDLAISPPLDLAPSPPADLAIAPPGDLARGLAPPPSDLAQPDLMSPSPCVYVKQDFASDPSATWTLQGAATYDATNQRLQVTAPTLQTAGSAFYNQPLMTVAFDASFDFRIDDGSGADGMAFVLVHSASTAGLAPFGNGVANAGYGLGYYGMDGYAVELDTFDNVGNGDPDGNHVGFMRTSDGTHLLHGTPPSPPLHSTSQRSAHITFTGAHVTVAVDGTSVIDADVPASDPFNPGVYFFGFTGASGGATDRHTVTNFTLVVGPAGVCF